MPRLKSLKIIFFSKNILDKIYKLFLFTFLFIALIFAQPTITSFTPTSGAVGTTVTITGTNFNSTPTNNTVWFGGVKATVSAASNNQLTVTVPVGAQSEPITVLNTGTKLLTQSINTFIVTFLYGTISSASIASKVDFATGSGPMGLSTGDLNGDGKLDMVVTNFYSNTVSVYKNTPTSGTISTGSFASKVDFEISSRSGGVEIRDIDGDGKLDLITSGETAHEISVLRNTSTSENISFATRVNFNVDSQPFYFAIGDLNGDGKFDIATANYGSGNISVLRNTSTSESISFATRVNFIVGSSPWKIAIGDVDGDGKLDIATPNRSSNTVSVLKNISTSGDISFETKVDFATGTQPVGISLRDLDGDELIDLAITNYDSHNISIYKNTSTSENIRFATKVDFATRFNPKGITISDIDGDGKLDIAATNYGSDLVSVLKNTSTSENISFSTKVDFTTGEYPESLLLGDIDGDNKVDIAVTNFRSNTVSVFRNIGFPPPTISSFTPTTGGAGSVVTITGTNFTSATAVSFGGTNATSFNVESATSIRAVVGSGTTGAVSITGTGGPVTSAGTFTFTNIPTITSFTPTSGAVGTTVTINGTNFNSNDTNNTVWFGGVKATVTAATNNQLIVTVPVGAQAEPITVLNLGTNLLIRTKLPFIVTFLDGTISPTSIYPKVDFATGTNPEKLAIGDLDGDGKLDQVVANSNSNNFSVFTNTSSNGSISFADKIDISTGTFPIEVSLGDLNGDGKLDVVITNLTSENISVHKNTTSSGSISFADKIDLIATGPTGIAIGDINNDGKLDLAIRRYGKVSIYRNTTSSGSISFADKIDINSSWDSFGINLGDLDGDGKLDLLVPNSYVNTFSIFKNISTVENIDFETNEDYEFESRPRQIILGDLDGDGKLDLSVAGWNLRTVSIFRNTSTIGSISLNQKEDFTTGIYSFFISFGDLDGDGKLDMATTNWVSNSISIFKNTSTIGDINFDSKVDFETGTNPTYISMGDIDGDNKIDIAVTNNGSNTVSVFRNIGFPPPTIESFTPTTGGAGTTITITGTNFTGATIVSIGGTNATSFNVESSTSITAVVASGATGAISVTTPGGTATSSGTFTFIPPPTIESFTPTTGGAGTTITITGTNFTGATIVSIGGTNATSFNVESSTSITAVVASGATGAISVTTSGGTATSSGTFTFTTINPTITNFTPTSGAIGSTVTITGTNFNISADSNIVWFGGVRAIVTAAIDTQLTVTVPIGAQPQPITVLNSETNLLAQSKNSFIVTFPNGEISSNSMSSAVDFETGYEPIGLKFGDIDGDGKLDMVVAHDGEDYFSIYRNTSTNGIINSNSFALNVDLGDNNDATSIELGDLDGDGKLDIVVTRLNNEISIYRNTSTIDSISFEAKINYNIGLAQFALKLGDIDGDGKLDMVYNISNPEVFTAISVSRNTSTSGIISFANHAIIYENMSAEISLGDIDGDGKLDIILKSSGESLSIGRNISTTENISFASLITLHTSDNGMVTLGDIDGDGDLDIAVSYYYEDIITIYNNSSTIGNIVFDEDVIELETGEDPNEIALGDLNGDGKLDIVVANSDDDNVSVFNNTTEEGDISFAEKVDYETGDRPRWIALGDIDGDGKLDLGVINYYDNSIYVFRNKGIPVPTISNFTPTSGEVGTSVTITGTNFNTNTEDNIVWFGGVQANVTFANNTQLTVLVPFGANAQPITVLNLEDNLLAQSTKPFVVTFPNGEISQTSLSTRVDFSTGDDPRKISFGDLNGDGKLDMVVTIDNLRRVSVYKNNSSSGRIDESSFAQKIDYATETDPRGLILGDLNGDGKLDMVVSNRSSDKVSVYKNTTRDDRINFATKINFTTGDEPGEMALGDLNGDGKLDLVVINYDDGSFSIYKNTSVGGSISFAERVTFDLSSELTDIAISDIDGDGKLDIVVTRMNSSTVSVYRNISISRELNTDSFSEPRGFETESEPSRLAFGDLDGDGLPELVVGHYSSTNLSVYKNNSTSGNISFADRDNFDVGDNQGDIKIGDLDGDGKLDLIIVKFNNNQISILRNVTDHEGLSFSESLFYDTGAYPSGIDLGDIDGDGKLDLGVVNSDDDNVSIFRNVGIIFPPPTITSFTPTSGVVGSRITITGTNFNTTAANNTVWFGGVKATDTAATETELTVTVPVGAKPNPITVLNNATNLLAQSVNPFIVTFPNGDISSTSMSSKIDLNNSTSVGDPEGLATGDLDGDGKLDIVVAYYASDKVLIFKNTASTTDLSSSSFSMSKILNTGYDPKDVKLGDLDGDGKLDIVVSNSSSNKVSVFRNTSSIGYLGDTSFTSKVDFTTGNNPNIISLSDIDGDGKLDIAVTNTGSNSVSVFRNTSIVGVLNINSFTAKVDFATGSEPSGIALGDLNNDRKPEMVVVNASSHSISIYQNNSTSGSISSNSFAAKVDLDTALDPQYRPFSVALGDIDGDGKLDIVYSIPNSGCFSVFRNNYNEVGNITTESFVNTGSPCVGNMTNFISLGDLDGDGKLDIVFTDIGLDNISIVKNISEIGIINFETLGTSRFETGLGVNALSLGDFNRDNKIDIAITNKQSDKVSVYKNLGLLSVITSFTPSSGPAGTAITITGKNFINVESVTIGGTDADTFTVESSTTISAVVGEGSTGNIEVITGLGKATSVETFTFIGPPIITSFTPTSGSSGTIVTITGEDFVNVTQVTFRGTNALSFEVININTIEAVVGSGSTGRISVTTANGTTTSSETFTFIPAPTISSFVPNRGPVDTTVLINGTNFNLTPANNFVWFGGVRANVTSASETQLYVSVPAGTTAEPITVLNTGTNLLAQSVNPFIVTFTNGDISTASLAARVNFTTESEPMGVITGDLDGDGKLDLVVANKRSNKISVYRNTTTSANLNSESFAAKVDFLTRSDPSDIKLGDLDGDGKLDIVVTNIGSDKISVYRNTSTSGALNTESFAAKVDFTTNEIPQSISLGDLDGDGKLDMTVTNFNSNYLSVYRNTSTSGNLNDESFAERVDFKTGSEPQDITLGDLNGDGKLDIIITNSNSDSISVYRNTSTSGALNTESFAAKVDFVTGLNPVGVKLGDIDGDGKLDVVISNSGSNKVSVFRNLSEGNIAPNSFAERVDFVTDSGPHSVNLGDLDGDGKLDLTVANLNSSNISIYKNTFTSGNITSTSFAERVDFLTKSKPHGVTLGDLDGDGKLDLVNSNKDSNQITIFRNLGLWPSITSFSPTSGPIGTTINITGSNFIGATVVRFGGVDAASFVVDSATCITAVVDSGATGNILVTTEGGDAVSSDSFTFIRVPSLTSFTPSRGSSGTEVTLIGTNFIEVSSVTFGGTRAASFIVVSDTSIKAVIGAGSTGIIAVTTAGGIATSEGTLTYIPTPTITSFTPTSGAVGSAVTVTGTNFNSTRENNIVWFGAVKAVVTSSTTTEIVVQVPIGSQVEPITVLNTEINLLAQSNKPFVVIFDNGDIVTSSMSEKVNFGTLAYPADISFGDLDGDGKLDVVVTNMHSNNISVYRNTATSGSIASNSFAAKVNFDAGARPHTIALGDIDRDGKIDISVTNHESNSISVYRNTSTTGSISSESFASKVDFETGTNPTGIVSGDFDGDGKLDLALTNYSSNSISVYRNTSARGTISSNSFAQAVDFMTEVNPVGITIGDIDMDGKLDIAVTNRNSNSISVYRNKSSVGLISLMSFEQKVDFTSGANPSGISIGDFDGDRKPDLVVANASLNSISVYRNTSRVESITSESFDAKVDFETGGDPTKIALGDIDGDGRLDIAVTNNGSNSISVYKNTSTNGTIDVNSFASKVDFSTGTSLYSISTGDLDGDGKIDMASASLNFNTFSIFRNVGLVPTITSISPTSGAKNTRLTITGTNLIGATRVTIGRTAADTFTVGSSTSILAVVGDGSSGNISVTTPLGTATSNNLFTFFEAPIITSFTPTSGGRNTRITITGTNLSGATEVTIGGTTVDTFTVESSTSIVAVVGSGATGKISITTPGGTAQSVDTFTFIPAPTITNFTPTSGTAGTTIVITGTNFTNATIVTFGGTSATSLIVDSSKSMRVVIGSGATGKISITTPGGIAQSIDNFTFIGAPSVAPLLLLPITNAINIPLENTLKWSSVVNATSYQLQISLNNNFLPLIKDTTTTDTLKYISEFLNGKKYYWRVRGINSSGSGPFGVDSFTTIKKKYLISVIAGINGTITPNRDTLIAEGDSIRFTINSNSGYQIDSIIIDGFKVWRGVTHQIATQVFNNIDSIHSIRSVFKTAHPTITNFTPTTGPSGAIIKITGNFFAGASSVKFGGIEAASFTVDSSSCITAVIGNGATGIISVTTAGGTATSNSSFTFIPAPTITGFTPTTGPTGTAITITGTNFTGATEISFGGVPSDLYQVVNSTTIRAVVANGSTGEIKVITPGGFATSSEAFTFIGTPTIVSITPTSGPLGRTVTITGTNFTTAYAVTIGGTAAASFVVDSSAIIKVVVGIGSTGRIKVFTLGGSATSTETFTYFAAPTITSISQKTGGSGLKIKITGTNFTNVSAVKIGGTAVASFVVDSSLSISAEVGSGTTGRITITTQGGIATSAEQFTFIEAPTITSFSPTTGPSGAEITIFGTNFTGTTSVTIGGVVALNTLDSSTILRAVVGSGTTGRILLTTIGGTATSTDTFTYIPAPTITSFTPNTGVSGSKIIITGTNFTGALNVIIGGTNAASFKVDSSSRIEAIVGSGATGTITVITPGGMATTLETFTFIPAPTITSFTPTAAASGSKITIAGSNFIGATEVTIGGTKADSFTVVSSSRIEAIVGSGATGIITVKTSGGTATTSEIFTFIPTRITLTSPNGGNGLLVGTNQNITWSSSAVNNVKIEYSLNSGTNWISIILSTPSSGSYSWKIPDTSSTNCKIKITDVSKSNVLDESDSVFTILKQPTMISNNKTITFGTTDNESSYKMLSIPGEQKNKLISTYLTGVQKNDWNVFWDNGNTENFQIEYNGSSDFEVKAGKGFWVLSKNKININDTVQSKPITTDGTYSIPLHQSWNIIGNPFEVDINWSSIKSINNLSANSNLYTWNNGIWENSTVMKPFEGYYFNNLQNNPNIQIPYPVSSKRDSSSAFTISKNKITIEFGDSKAFISFDDKSIDGFDENDYLSPVSGFEQTAVYILNEEFPKRQNRMFAESRSRKTDGQEYNLELINKAENSALLKFNFDNFSENSLVYFVDETYGYTFDIKEKKEIRIPHSKNRKKYKLLIGSRNYIDEKLKNLIPKEFELFQNYPNPFNPKSKIRYAVAKNSFINIKVYDVLGREVATLVNEMKPAGYYELLFDGSNFTSGIYYYKLTTSDFSITKKMVIIK